MTTNAKSDETPTSDAPAVTSRTTLKKLIIKAKAQGYITLSDINSLLPAGGGWSGVVGNPVVPSGDGLGCELAQRSGRRDCV